MRVLGIDVGFAICGWSIVEYDKNYKNNLHLINYGALTTHKDEAEALRIEKIYDGLDALIKEYKPEHTAIEDIFFFKNQKTVMKVGQVRGAILLTAQKNNLEIHSYTPLQVKVGITGYGRAEKAQIQNMVKMIFGLKEIPKPDDASDAIAIAVCHLNTISSQRKLQ